MWIFEFIGLGAVTSKNKLPVFVFCRHRVDQVIYSEQKLIWLMVLEAGNKEHSAGIW
jgi:hypothetical protein